MSDFKEMNPASRRSAEELLAEAERLLEGNESLSRQETIRAPVVFLDCVKELLHALIEEDDTYKALNSR